MLRDKQYEVRRVSTTGDCPAWSGPQGSSLQSVQSFAQSMGQLSTLDEAGRDLATVTKVFFAEGFWWDARRKEDEEQNILESPI